MPSEVQRNGSIENRVKPRDSALQLAGLGLAITPQALPRSSDSIIIDPSPAHSTVGEPILTYAVLASIFDIGFGLFHLMFWRLFGWPTTLTSAGKINAAVAQTLNVMLTYCFFAYGAVLFWLRADENVGVLALTGAGFWFLRALLQPIFFSIKHRLSIVLTMVFLVGGALHAAASLVHP